MDCKIALHSITNVGFRIVQNQGERSYFCRIQEDDRLNRIPGLAADPIK